MQAADDIKGAIVGKDCHPSSAQISRGYVVTAVNEKHGAAR